MGLDMYLTARVSYYGYDKEFNKKGLPNFQLPAPLKKLKDKMSDISFQLAYWRKHPNLHGYIVNNFGGGVDECQPIYLSLENIDELIGAVKVSQLPETEGFFFGVSDESEEAKKGDIKTFTEIKKQVEEIQTNKGYFVDLYYRASW
jgi:hypothetical protein